MYIVQNTFTMHQNLCIVSVQRTFPRNETYLKTKSMNVKGVHCTVGVAKIFRFTCTLFWSIPTYGRTLLQSFSKK